jgi:hypothetical protein
MKLTPPPLISLVTMKAPSSLKSVKSLPCTNTHGNPLVTSQCYHLPSYQVPIDVPTPTPPIHKVSTPPSNEVPPIFAIMDVCREAKES